MVQRARLKHGDHCFTGGAGWAGESVRRSTVFGQPPCTPPHPSNCLPSPASLCTLRPAGSPSHYAAQPTVQPAKKEPEPNPACQPALACSTTDARLVRWISGSVVGASCVKEASV